MTTIEELQGIVAGLVSVVKELTTNVSQVNHTVGNMAQSAPAASNSHSLRMPSIQLPSFCRDSVVQDDILEFLERFIQQTSHLPAETRLSLLEQQCVADWPRSVTSIAKTTEGYPGEATEEKLNTCIERLRAEFGESKEDKCRRLATELRAIEQEHGESVGQHKCQRCNKWGCKAIRHTEPLPTSMSHSSAPSDEVTSLGQQLVVFSTRLNKFEA